jgi:hypothetical protein
LIPIALGDLADANGAYLRPGSFPIGPGRRDPVPPAERRLQPGWAATVGCPTKVDRSQREDAWQFTRSRLTICRTQRIPCRPVGMAPRGAKGDENPRGSGEFDEPRKGWPGGQPRTRGSALLRLVFDRARQSASESMRGCRVSGKCERRAHVCAVGTWWARPSRLKHRDPSNPRRPRLHTIRRILFRDSAQR